MKSFHLQRLAAWVVSNAPFFALASVFALLPLCLVIFTAGWPQNHENLQFFDRTLVWADHFRLGDLLPVWSSSDAFGFGTPLPLYYQKLFHVVNALFLLTFGSLKVATVVTLYLFSLLGIYGLRAAMGYVARSRAVITLVPLILPLSSYMLADWLVRGAMAEMTALAIIPWLIWWGLRLVKTGQLSYWIILIFPALFYAHNAIALLSVLFVGAVLLALLTDKKMRKNAINSWRRVLICLGAITILIVPSLLLQSAMNKEYNPADKIDDIQNLDVGFRSLTQYFFDRSYVWLQSGEGLTIQIDILLWTSLLLLATAVLWLRRKRSGRVLPKDKAFWVIVVSLAIYGVLQLKVSRPIYDLVHVLSLVQFPWRMLAVITPLLILLLGMCADRLAYRLDKKGERFVAPALTGWLLLFVALSPLTYPDSIPRMAIRNDYPEQPLYASGEYLPITYEKDGQLIDNEGMIQRYNQLRTPDPRIKDISPGKEALEKVFDVQVETDDKLFLPVSYSRFSEVYVNGEKVKTFRDPHDPRLQILLRQGTSRVRVLLPSVERIVNYRP